MNTLTVLIFCISVALSQCQSILTSPGQPTTIASTVTDPLDALQNEVLVNQTSPTPTPAPVLNETLPVGESDFNEILTFGDNVIFVISERLNSLSPEMRPVGENILADTRDGLQSCERSLRQNGTIWEYKVCCSSYLRYGTSALAGLAQDNYRSGAGRATLFFM